MTLTPDSLVRHELTGLWVRVADSTNPDLVEIGGRIIRESMKTLQIESDTVESDRVRTIPKHGCIFEFSLPDDETVTVRGDRLIARPARRSENGGESIWHSV